MFFRQTGILIFTTFMLAFALSGAVRVVPGYAGVSFCISADGETAPVIEIREKGKKDWQTACEPVLSADKKEYRTSVFDLPEGTCFEYRVSCKDGIRNGVFTTKKSEVRIAENIELTPENFKDHLVITRSGRADGYIRYTMKPGTVLKSGTKYPEAILLKNASCIILDGLTVRGGGHSSIQVSGCKNILIKNCDIGMWGTERKPYDLRNPVNEQDSYRRLQLEGKRNINNQSGIKIRDCEDILIERNYIHDPMSKANSWFYTHPWGPQGIHCGFSKRVTIRWNDIIGGDNHRFNDVIESWGNGHPDGGPGTDAEIYGNYLAFCNDDAVELDGSQQNVRFFHNRLEGFFAGVSTAPCIKGPSYIAGNLLMKPGDEFGKCNAMIKTGGFAWYPGKTFIFGNTFIGNKLAGYAGTIRSFSPFTSAIKPEYLKILKLTAVNNVFYDCKPGTDLFYRFNIKLVNNIYGGTNRGSHPDKKLEPESRAAKLDFTNCKAGDFTLKTKIRGAEISNIPAGVGISKMMPARPLEMVSSHYTVELDLKKATQKIILRSTGFEGALSVFQPQASGFFTVTPSTVHLQKGKAVELVVTAAANRMSTAQVHSGAFVIRTSQGLSLPVSVYFDNRDDMKLVKANRSKAIYGKVVAVSPKQVALEFDGVPDGRYYLFVRVKPYPYHAKLTVPGEKGYMSVFYPGMRPENSGWAHLPWNKMFKLKVPRRVNGKFTVNIEHERANNINCCALAETPEEMLSACNKL